MSTPVFQSARTEPNLYINGCQISRASATTITVATGALRGSSNEVDLEIDSELTIDGAATGANGLDQGSLANSTWYAVFIIGDSAGYKETAAILTTSSTQPLVPIEYDTIRRIGWVKTNGSAEFLEFQMRGEGKERTVFWDAIIQVQDDGASTSYAAVDCSGAAPSTSQTLYLLLSYTPNTAGSLASLRPTGSTSTTNVFATGSVASEPNTTATILPCDSDQSIDYVVANALDTLDINVHGYIDYI